MRKLKSILAVLFVCAVCANATIVKDFNENGTIESGDYYDVVNIWDSAIVNMTGGVVEGCNIYNTAVLNYTDGEIGYFIVFDCTTVNVHSSHETGFELKDYGKIYLHNGGSDFDTLVVSGNAQLHIYGYNLTCTQGISRYTVEGLWEDSQQSFSMAVRYAGGITPQIILHEVPEPTAILLFTLGGVLLRRTHS